MSKVKNKPWFVEFMEKVIAGPEPEVVDESEVIYDVEGNVVNKNKKVKGYENEVDGVVYDAEGNVLRSVNDEAPELTEDDSADKIVKAEESSENTQEKKEGDSKKIENLFSR